MLEKMESLLCEIIIILNELVVTATGLRDTLDQHRRDPVSDPNCIEPHLLPSRVHLRKDIPLVPDIAIRYQIDVPREAVLERTVDD